jgi:hypothetical protein
MYRWRYSCFSYLGHEAVWHGYADIIVTSHHGPLSSDIAVKTLNKHESDNSANEEVAETSTPQKKRKLKGDCKS